MNVPLKGHESLAKIVVIVDIEYLFYFATILEHTELYLDLLVACLEQVPTHLLPNDGLMVMNPMAYRKKKVTSYKSKTNSFSP